ncbi:MAG TPA: Gfo/Idh/MocA family oxidoreductase [Methylomirabilota bacterium]|jgi:predicted dehydrogenase|nr:Gfo/Idh/MocA family oxidoreductase [Methylomirabilota bacterium]
MERLRVGVIGAGVMGERHAQIYTTLPDVELNAVCDVREDAARRVASLADAAVCTDWRGLLGRPDIDAVSVCTPDDAHRAPCEAAAAAGKHILVEKPIATTVADAEAIIAAAERAGVVLLVGHCLRFDPRHYAARAAVAGGELGVIQTIYTRRSNTVAAQDRLGGRCSLPLFLGVHDYDVMRWLLASEVERVSAESKWGLLRSRGYPVEDANCALLRFASGALGIAELNWVLPRGFPAAGDHRADIVGERGALSIASLETGLRRADDQRAVQVDAVAAPIVYGHAGGMFYFELRHFVDVIRRRRPLAVTPADGLMALRIALAVEQSAATGRSVAP